MSWTELGFANFVEAFEGLWPTSQGQYRQRRQLLDLIREQIHHNPVDYCVKALRHIKINEAFNRIPTIARLREAIMQCTPKFSVAVVTEQGIPWCEFVRTHDWEEHMGRLISEGKNIGWIEKMVPRWRKGEHLLASMGVKQQRVAAHKRRREPGDDDDEETPIFGPG